MTLCSPSKGLENENNKLKMRFSNFEALYMLKEESDRPKFVYIADQHSMNFRLIYDKHIHKLIFPQKIFSRIRIYISLENIIFQITTIFYTSRFLW